jgi:hypothetical protein
MTTDVFATAGTSRKEPEAMSVLEASPQKAQAVPGAENADGPNPFAVVGAALLGGVVLAKWIAWRGNGHSSR